MSIFTMDDVNHVIGKSVEDAKAHALTVINSAENVKPMTITKARQMIYRCKTAKAVAFGMSGWILAHPSNNLKVVKVLAAGTV